MYGDGICYAIVRKIKDMYSDGICYAIVRNPVKWLEYIHD